MARYQVILAYDGTQYHGFQRQSRDHGRVQALTVQGVVEAALHQMGWRGRSILAAGRTDAGVHASGQVIAFDMDWKHSPDELQSALNARLPSDVAALSAKSVSEVFHPRFDAVARHYRYQIYCQDVRAPLKDRYAWRVWPPVEIETLNRAASHLRGTHDFSAFGTPPQIEGSTVRRVAEASWQRFIGANETSQDDRPDLIFDIVANAFLYRMVRRLVFIQVAIGQGRLDEEKIVSYLTSPPESVVQGLAPPQGLTLVSVEY